VTFDLVNPYSIQVVKYESFVTNSSQDNERKKLLTFFKVTLVTLTFDLLNPKSIEFLSLPRPISMHVKYESSVINTFQDNGLNQLFY